MPFCLDAPDVVDAASDARSWASACWDDDEAWAWAPPLWALLFPLELLVDRRVRNLAPLETLEMMLPVIDEVSDEKVLTLCVSHTLEASSDRIEDGAALEMMDAVSDPSEGG